MKILTSRISFRILRGIDNLIEAIYKAVTLIARRSWAILTDIVCAFLGLVQMAIYGAGKLWQAYKKDRRGFLLRAWGAIGLTLMCSYDYEHASELIGDLILCHGVIALACSAQAWEELNDEESHDE